MKQISLVCMVFSLICTSLYTMNDSTSHNEDACLICLETFTKDVLRVTCIADTPHAYHCPCILKWLKEKDKESEFKDVCIICHTLLFTEEDLAKMHPRDIEYLIQRKVIPEYNFSAENLETMSVDGIKYLIKRGLIPGYHFTDDRLAKMSLDELRDLADCKIIDAYYYKERMKAHHIIYNYPLFALIQDLYKEVCTIMEKYQTIDYEKEIIFNADKSPSDDTIINLHVYCSDYSYPFWLITPWGKLPLIPKYHCKIKTESNKTHHIYNHILQQKFNTEEKLQLMLEIETWINNTFGIDIEQKSPYIDVKKYNIKTIHTTSLRSLIPKNTLTSWVDPSEKQEALVFLTKKYESLNCPHAERPSKKKKTQ